MTSEELETLGIYADRRNTTPHERPDWDHYFLEIAEQIAKRSPDAQTQFGAVLVRNKRIISTGYNGWPSGCPDRIMPNIRPFKYWAVVHAENNAILNAAKEGVSVNGATLFVGGMPCSSCSKILVSVGITDWVIGTRKYQETEQESLMRKFWIKTFNVKVRVLT